MSKPIATSRPIFRHLTASFLYSALMLMLCSSLHTAFGQSFDEDGTAYVSYPLNGATIGQGLLLDSGLASTDVCITGTVSPVGQPPQVTSISIRDNKDASSFFKQTGVTAAAQAKFLVGSADAKFTFISTQQFMDTNSVISVYATVQQRHYITPAGILPNDNGKFPDVHASGGIRLTPQARKQASKDPAAFKRMCGDGFIAVLIEGAEITGSVTVQDTGQAGSSTLSTLAQAEAFGGEVSTTLDEVLKATKSHYFSEIRFVQFGGAGEPGPVNEDDLLAAVKNLPKAASDHPQQFSVIVRDYRSLPNWPSNINNGGSADELSQIMTTYWRLDALMRQTNLAAKQPKNYTSVIPGQPVPISYLLGFNGATASRLLALYDEMNLTRNELAAQAETCLADHTKCDAPVLSSIGLYKFAVQLPLPFGSTPTTSEYIGQLATVGSVVRVFNATKSNLYAFAVYHYGTDGSCYYRDHYVTQMFEGAGYPKNIAVPLTEFSSFQDSLPTRLRDDAVDYYVRQPARSRCEQSQLDSDCHLTEADFQLIGRSIVLKGSKIVSNFDPDKTYRYGKCPGGNYETDTEHLTLTYPPDN